MATHTSLNRPSITFETTFLIPNLHCPSCIGNITTLMEDYNPRPTVRDISVINHTFTVSHDRRITAASLFNGLILAGFDCFDVVLDPCSLETNPVSGEDKGPLEEAVTRWSPKSALHVNDEVRAKHIAHCKLCEVDGFHEGEFNALQSVVAIDPSIQGTSFSAVLSVDEMTCSSCVGAVNRALESVEGVESADVSLLSRSARVAFTSIDGDATIKNLLAAVEDAGFVTSLIESKERPIETADTTTADQGGQAERQVSLRIDGMHCSQCPMRISQAVQDLEVKVTTMATLKVPIMSIRYKPNSPLLTIRHIIEAISDIDPAFAVSIHKPVLLEERARRMLARERRSIFLRAVLCLLTAVPALIIGVVYMDLVSETNAGHIYLAQRICGIPRAEWAMFVLASITYLFATDHFHRRALKEVYVLWRAQSQVSIARRLYRFGSMNMLISLGTTVAYFSSLAEIIIAATSESQNSEQGFRASYFDSVVFLTMFLLFGRLAEAHMKAKSGDAISALGKLRPTEALLLMEDGSTNPAATVHVDVDLLEVGDEVRVLHGASPPCDGTLVDGDAVFDEASLTGESRLVKKRHSEEIFSGTINKGSSVTIKITNPAESSMLDSIIQVVREGQAKRAPIERVADILTAYFVPAIVVIAVITWLVWLLLGLSNALPADYLDSGVGAWPFWALQFAIAVFVVACPCGLGLAAPTALFVGSGMAARRGILVKGGGEAFQEASDLDVVVFDKTGTLTAGTEPVVVAEDLTFPHSGLDRSRILGTLKALEENSTHPLARAAVVYAASEGAVSPLSSAVDEIVGKGLIGSFTHQQDDGTLVTHRALVGNEALLNDYGIPIPQKTADLLMSWKHDGHSIMILALSAPDGEWSVAATFALSTPIRPEAADVITALQKLGVQVWMLSGDNAITATAVGRRVGIGADNIIAGVLPAQKAEKIKYLQCTLSPSPRTTLRNWLTPRRKRATVAMVGDGVNDAPALAAADVGIAVASGSDVAVQSASFILIHSELTAILALLSLSRAVFRRVLFNFFWAAIYNMMAVPIAAGVLYPITTGNGSRVRLDPAWAALAMALSSITVVGSSLLLRTRVPLVGYRS